MFWSIGFCLSPHLHNVNFITVVGIGFIILSTIVHLVISCVLMLQLCLLPLQPEYLSIASIKLNWCVPKQQSPFNVMWVYLAPYPDKVEDVIPAAATYIHITSWLSPVIMNLPHCTHCRCEMVYLCPLSPLMIHVMKYSFNMDWTGHMWHSVFPIKRIPQCSWIINKAKFISDILTHIRLLINLEYISITQL